MLKREYLTADNQYRLFLNNNYDDGIATKVREHKNNKYVNIDSYVNTTLTTKLQRFKYVSHLKTKSNHCHVLLINSSNESSIYDESSIYEMNVENSSIDIKLFPLKDKKQVRFLTDYLGMTITNKDTFKDYLEPIIRNSVKSISSLVHFDVEINKHFLLVLILDGNNTVHLFCFDLVNNDDGNFTYWNSIGMNWNSIGMNWNKSFDECISCSLCYEHDYEESNLLMNVFIQNSVTKKYMVNSIRFEVSDVHITATNKHTPKLTVHDTLIGGKVVQTVDELQLVLHSSYYSPSENRLVHRVIDKQKNKQFK